MEFISPIITLRSRNLLMRYVHIRDHCDARPRELAQDFSSIGFAHRQDQVRPKIHAALSSSCPCGSQVRQRWQLRVPISAELSNSHSATDIHYAENSWFEGVKRFALLTYLCAVSWALRFSVEAGGYRSRSRVQMRRSRFRRASGFPCTSGTS